MNLYGVNFNVQCPANLASIAYRLEIRSNAPIPVEQIAAAVKRFRIGYHEEIADVLAALLPGHQTISAHHHGVDIVSTREGRGHALPLTPAAVARFGAVQPAERGQTA